MRAFLTSYNSRRSFLKRLFCNTGVAFLSTSSLSFLSSKLANNNVPKTYVIQFKYTAISSDDIDAYIQSITVPAMTDFRSYWQNTKKTIVTSAREDFGKSLITKHRFQTENDLKEFWEAAKYIPGKIERKTFGISRDYSIFTLPA